MNEFIPEELAVKLCKKGFPKPNKIVYAEYKDGKICPMEVFFATRDVFIIAPTISQVLWWLKKEKKLHIAIDIWGGTWGYDIIHLVHGHSLHWEAYCESINSYEQAAIAGISYVVDNLI